MTEPTDKIPDEIEGPGAPIRKKEAAYPTVPLQLTWQVRLPHVYRIMEKQYVDAFFATGALQLSSFSRFRTNPDEIRADEDEGGAVLRGRHGEMETIFIDVSLPIPAWVLCGTTVFDPSYMRRFGDACIRIHDPLAFGTMISNEIPYFGGGYEGFCLYQSAREVRRELGSRAEAGLVGNEKDGYALRIDGQLGHNLNSADRYFVKLLKYNKEAEYRWIWRANKQSSQVLQIVCPDARDFCDRVNI